MAVTPDRRRPASPSTHRSQEFEILRHEAAAQPATGLLVRLYGAISVVCGVPTRPIGWQARCIDSEIGRSSEGGGRAPRAAHAGPPKTRKLRETRREPRREPR